jgi:microcystin-dependent protein
MAQPYVGEIRLFGGTFAIAGWAFCNGALQSISQNPTLYQLIGTTYGGDGVNTFALPDLQGRVPVHVGQGAGLQNYVLGQKGGVQSVTLITAQLPAHPHIAMAGSGAAQSSPANTSWGAVGNNTYGPGASADKTMNAGTMGPSNGGNQPHDNMLPFLVLTFIISLYGVYPSP